MREDSLLLDLEGYAGPLDLLLDLARRRKLDLLCLSVADLADQYLAFLDSAKALQLSVKAEYLVMAAQLTRLKARLLAPNLDRGEQEEAERAAQELRESLITLQRARYIAVFLRARPQLGRDMFGFGAESDAKPKPAPLVQEVEASFLELLEAYARIRSGSRKRVQPVSASPLYKYEQAHQALTERIGREWQTLWSCVPRSVLLQAQSQADSALFLRSVASGFFCAMLALVHNRTLEISQHSPYGELQVRTTTPSPPLPSPPLPLPSS